MNSILTPKGQLHSKSPYLLNDLSFRSLYIYIDAKGSEKLRFFLKFSNFL